MAEDRVKLSTISPLPSTAGTVKSGACLPTSTLIDISWCRNLKFRVRASLSPSGDSPVTRTLFARDDHHTLRVWPVRNGFSLFGYPLRIHGVRRAFGKYRSSVAGKLAAKRSESTLTIILVNI